jgi:very-short-patch-repair endonuclease
VTPALTPQDDARRLNTPPLQGRGRGWGLSAEKLAQLHERAAHMRRNPTEPEKRLWRQLSNGQLGGFKFRRQSVVGWFIADFLCPQRAFIVEVDGDTHDEANDRVRDDVLARDGYCVVRVSNLEVMSNIEGVVDVIGGALNETSARWARPHPNPSPEGEGLGWGAEAAGDFAREERGVKQHSVAKRVQFAGGAKIRAEVGDNVHQAAAALQKRVCERAQEFEPSGDPADVVAKAALTKCGHQRNMLMADYHAFLSHRDGRSGLAMVPPITSEEIDRQIGESQPYIELFERDLLDAVTLAVVEFRAARTINAEN